MQGASLLKAEPATTQPHACVRVRVYVCVDAARTSARKAGRHCTHAVDTRAHAGRPTTSGDDQPHAATDKSIVDKPSNWRTVRLALLLHSHSCAGSCGGPAAPGTLQAAVAAPPVDATTAAAHASWLGTAAAHKHTPLRHAHINPSVGIMVAACHTGAWFCACTRLEHTTFAHAGPSLSAHPIHAALSVPLAVWHTLSSRWPQGAAGRCRCHHHHHDHRHRQRCLRRRRRRSRAPRRLAC